MDLEGENMEVWRMGIMFSRSEYVHYAYCHYQIRCKSVACLMRYVGSREIAVCTMFDILTVIRFRLWRHTHHFHAKKQ
jgi:hypothetical protein